MFGRNPFLIKSNFSFLPNKKLVIFEDIIKKMFNNKMKLFQYSSNLQNELSASNLDLTVSILTMGYWPTYPVMEVTLPLEMVQYQDVFNKFYLGKHSGRKLQWQPTLGHCVLKAWFQQVILINL